MRDLASLAALYGEVDAYLEALRSQAANNSDPQGIARAEVKQRLNDQAYFVLCWGQIEFEIDETCRKAIRAKQGDSNWSARRGWDIYNPDDKRLSGLSFEDRVALVLDRQGGRDSPWARVMFYYALRNHIAHGRLRPDRIDVPTVVGEFYRIQAALTI